MAALGGLTGDCERGALRVHRPTNEFRNEDAGVDIAFRSIFHVCQLASFEEEGRDGGDGVRLKISVGTGNVAGGRGGTNPEERKLQRHLKELWEFKQRKVQHDGSGIGQGDPLVDLGGSGVVVIA